MFNIRNLILSAGLLVFAAFPSFAFMITPDVTRDGITRDDKPAYASLQHSDPPHQARMWDPVPEPVGLVFAALAGLTIGGLLRTFGARNSAQ
jgi:hypothetical protein